MKKIILKQYIQVCRTVEVEVDDDYDEKDAAMELDEMPLCLDKSQGAVMPDNAVVKSDWDYISDMGIENQNGETVYENG